MKDSSATEKPLLILHEDWLTVILGFAIILTSLFVFVIPVPSLNWKSDTAAALLARKNLMAVLAQFFCTFVIGLVPVLLYKKNLRSYLVVFPVLFLLAIGAQWLAGNSTIKSLNLEAVIFSLLLGLLIGNFVKLPDWFRAALSTEFFVKIGLVLLGTSVLFSDILKAGSLGLIQALVVVVSVWYFAFWVCRKFKLDQELTMMLSSAVSICGVSAAIATAGAIKGDGKKLSYVISLVLITAIPMMLLMPYAARYLGLSEEETGAWLGGTIDTTGAVVAAGSLVGETALKVSSIVKFSQNVLLGLAAFAISVYWTYTRNPTVQAKPTLGVIWERFPKFVLGFVAASLLYSFFIDAEAIAQTKDSLKGIQTLWFVLAFTSIGLETRISDLFSGSVKPLFAFLLAQSFNILITLLVAYLLF